MRRQVTVTLVFLAGIAFLGFHAYDCLQYVLFEEVRLNNGNPAPLLFAYFHKILVSVLIATELVLCGLFVAIVVCLRKPSRGELKNSV